MKVKSFFRTHPVFRYSEFASFMRGRGIESSASIRKLLNYHHQAGHLVHIRRNLYAVLAGSFEGPRYLDPYLIGSKAAEDAILGYHTGLELHGLAYTTFNEITYISSRRLTGFSFEGQNYRPALMPKALIKSGHTDFGVETIHRNGLDLRVTNLERTLVDIIDRVDLGGGFEEIYRSLENVVRVNAHEILSYALLLNNTTTIAKLGYFLDLLSGHVSGIENITKVLQEHLPKVPHNMVRSREGKGRLIKKWNLIVPVDFIEKTWEEPNEDNH